MIATILKIFPRAGKMHLKDQWTLRTKVEGEDKMRQTISVSLKEKVKEKKMRRAIRRMYKNKERSKGF